MLAIAVVKQPTPRRTFLSLAMARYVAALWVVAFHLQPIDRESEPVRNLIGSGYVACSFFFVLSGFVLAHSNLDASGALISSARSFLDRRVLRIAPAHLIALAALVVVMTSRAMLTWQSATETPGTLVGSALLVQAWDPRFATSWNFPAWSISVELAFYLLFPVLAPRLARMRALHGLAVVGVLWTLPLWADCVWVHALPDGTTTPSTPELAFWHNALRYHPLARLPEFAVGVWLARAFVARGAQAWEKQHGAAIAFASATAVAVCVTLLGERPYPFSSTLYTPAFALLIYGLASWDDARGTKNTGRLFEVLGDASYPLYILQIPVALALGAYRPHSFRRWLLCLAVLHLFALIVSRMIERPLRAWWRTRSAAATPPQ